MTVTRHEILEFTTGPTPDQIMVALEEMPADAVLINAEVEHIDSAQTISWRSTVHWKFRREISDD